MLKTLAALGAVLALSGCATVMNDTTHPLRIETVMPTGEAVVGAPCKVAGEYGTFAGLSGDVIQLRRGNQDLEVSCKSDANLEARGRLVSRANAGMVGNILIGGLIGAVIDHSKGTGYTYPTWVRLVFGRVLVFDRADEQVGQPVSGREPSQARQSDGAKSNERATVWDQQRW